MKNKLLIVIALLLLCFPVHSQNSGPGYAQLNDFSMPFMRSVFWLRSAIPAGSVPILTMSGTNSVRIHTDTTFINTLANRNDTVVYKLVQIGSDAMLRAFVPSYLVYRDTLNLSNRIDLKFNTTDTTNKWLSIGYVPNWNSITNKPNFLDSSTLYTFINGKLSIGDTTGHWVNIGRYVSDSITLRALIDTKMDKADSVKFYPMFSNPKPYLTGADTINLSNLVAQKLNQVDTSAHWTPLTRNLTINGVTQNLTTDRFWNVGTLVGNDTLSLSNRINGKLNTSDTANHWYPLSSNPSGYLTTITSGQVTSALGYTPLKPADTTGKWKSSSYTPTSSEITTALGFTPYNSTNPNGYISSITSGNVTTALGYTPVTNARTLTINGTTQDLSANRTWSVGTVTSTGLTTGTTGTDVNVSGSPITSSGNITLNIPTASATNRGVLSTTDWSTFNNKQNKLKLTTNNTSGAATFSNDTLNIPTYVAAAPTFNNTPSRSLNSSFQVSTTNNSRVSYTVSCATGLALLNLNSTAQVFLEISSNNSTWTTIAGGGNTQTLSVAISLGINTTQLQNLQCEVPAGYWVRLRTVTSGGGTTTFSSGQEVIY